MGSCFSKKTTTPQQIELTPNPHNTKNQQQLLKKEIFVIKHRTSHEIDTHPDQDNKNNPTVRTSSCTKEEVDAVLIQCGRLSRSASAGAENPSRRRRYSGSKRSFDFGLEMASKIDDEAQREPRASSPSSRRSSTERDQRSCSKERGSGRRVSISPNRSESPFPNSNNRPVKMVAVPATDKSNKEVVAGGGVKRIHVKRNVGDAAAIVGGSRIAASPRSRSPARANFRVLIENQQQGNSRKGHSPYRRNPLTDIDNNAAGSERPGNQFGCFLQKPNGEKITDNKSKEQLEVDEAEMAPMVPTGVGNLKLCHNITRTRSSRLSRDLDIDPATLLDPVPPSYASLLLEDIHNFHQKNTTTAAAMAPPGFSLPACVSKACSIMEAVADLNSTTSSDRRRNPKPTERRVNRDSLLVNDDLMEANLNKYVNVRRGVSAATGEQESSGSNSFAGGQHLNWLLEPNSAGSTNWTSSSRSNAPENDVSPMGRFQRELLDHPRNGIGRGRTSAYSMPNSTTIAST